MKSVGLFLELNFVFRRLDFSGSWEIRPSGTRVSRKPQLSNNYFSNNCSDHD